MSYQAQTWVDEVGIKHCKNGGELLVLIRVANHTNGEMRGCYASAETLAGECLMGESTVLKHLRRLKAGGVLLPGDPELVSHLRADRRPPVYDLAGGHETGCPGGHSVGDVCHVEATGARSEHPSKPARATGARSEHPSKKRRSAGAQSEHPSKETPATGVQIDLSRVFKSSTNSSKDLNSLFFVPAGAFGAQPSQQPHEREREAAAPEASGADVVVDAYVRALGRPLVNGSRQELRAQAASLLATGAYTLDWLCERAAEMPARGYRDLVTHAQHPSHRLPGQAGPVDAAGSGGERRATPEQVAALRARIAANGSGL
ncbi:helix-turn-helix domain-containing protein [Streptomyces sp. NPDC096046]|uniref:helix-turn-helix domain-containing protein n=1 Tax=Streptomyces sp. NPDC096046 TaxID=3155542 RepID=UPI00333257B3